MHVSVCASIFTITDLHLKTLGFLSQKYDMKSFRLTNTCSRDFVFDRLDTRL